MLWSPERGETFFNARQWETFWQAIEAMSIDFFIFFTPTNFFLFFSSVHLCGYQTWQTCFCCFQMFYVVYRLWGQIRWRVHKENSFTCESKESGKLARLPLQILPHLPSPTDLLRRHTFTIDTYSWIHWPKVWSQGGRLRELRPYRNKLLPH